MLCTDFFEYVTADSTLKTTQRIYAAVVPNIVGDVTSPNRRLCIQVQLYR